MKKKPELTVNSPIFTRKLEVRLEILSKDFKQELISYMRNKLLKKPNTIDPIGYKTIEKEYYNLVIKEYQTN